ncbi:MAG: hypothetical protein P0S95_03130 [Rhabdochlamydiaceae bacterium]|nr:hypothetical protein [Candidatus Amphrikana amoebophyrae]
MSFPVQPGDHINFMNAFHQQNESPIEALCHQLQDKPMSKDEVTQKLSFLNEIENTSSDPHAHAEIRDIKNLMSSSFKEFQPQSELTNQLIDSLQRLPL